MFYTLHLYENVNGGEHNEKKKKSDSQPSKINLFPESILEPVDMTFFLFEGRDFMLMWFFNSSWWIVWNKKRRIFQLDCPTPAFSSSLISHNYHSSASLFSLFISLFFPSVLSFSLCGFVSVFPPLYTFPLKPLYLSHSAQTSCPRARISPSPSYSFTFSSLHPQ